MVKTEDQLINQYVISRKRMSGRGRNDDKVSKEGAGGGGGGRASTFWKVASAAAATVVVAGGLYSVLKQPRAEQVKVGGGGSGGAVHTKEGAADVWTKPMVGWVKLNVGGSLLRAIPSGLVLKAGYGGVIRDASGEWVYGFAQKLSPYPSLKEDQVVKDGILRGLQWAKDKGLKKLVVESDNEGIVYMVNSGFKSTDSYILSIRELLYSPQWQVTLTSIRGKANEVANKLADIARELPSYNREEIDSPPEDCLEAFIKDRCT